MIERASTRHACAPSASRPAHRAAHGRARRRQPRRRTGAPAFERVARGAALARPVDHAQRLPAVRPRRRSSQGRALARCVQWKREVPRWLAAASRGEHVFVAQHSGGPGSRARGGQTQFAAQVSGFANAWKALPPSVEHVIVSATRRRCEARRRLRREGDVRSSPRRRGVRAPRTPALPTATRRPSPSPRGHGAGELVDMTRFLCDGGPATPSSAARWSTRTSSHLTAVYARVARARS